MHVKGNKFLKKHNHKREDRLNAKKACYKARISNETELEKQARLDKNECVIEREFVMKQMMKNNLG